MLKLLAPARDEKQPGEVRFVPWIKAGYVPILEWCLQNRMTVLVLAGGLRVPSAVGLTLVRRDFMPKLDEGAWVIATVTPAETPLEGNNRITRQTEMMLLQDPDVTGVIRRHGRPERAIGHSHSDHSNDDGQPQHLRRQERYSTHQFAEDTGHNCAPAGGGLGERRRRALLRRGPAPAMLALRASTRSACKSPRPALAAGRGARC